MFLVFMVMVGNAAIPQRINYEGRLTDSAGNPLTGFYNMRFSITSDSGGSTSIWGPEYHTSVTVTEGVFTVTLGNNTSIPVSVFSDDTRYLKIEIANPATSANYEVLTPHTQLVSVGYAFKSAQADEALSVSDGSITTAKITSEAVTEGKLDSLDLPADGEYLSWNNAQGRFEWKAAAGTGTVTQVDTGTGLSGGPINTTGTIAIDGTVVTLSGTQTLTNKTFSRVQVDNANTYVDRDGSNNMTLTDTVTGTRTLAQLAAGGGSGTVTSVDTGTGLTGGPITTSGTVSVDSTVVTLTGSQTLTNKTIDADSNSISNIDDGEIKAAAGIAYSKLNLSNSVVSGDIAADAVTEPKLDALDTPANAEVLSWNNASSRFEWVAAGGTGTVTSVGSGTGLIGGPVNTTGTLSIDSTVATLTGAQTLTNKTVDADNNTLSNIDNNEIKAAAGIVYSKLNLSNSIVPGDLTANSVTASAIASDAVTEPKLDALDTPANAEVLSWNNASSRFEWVAAGGTGTVTQVDTGTGLIGGPVNTTGTLSIDSTVVTLTGAQTLTNKTIDADSNSISNIDDGEIKAAAGIAYSKLNLSNSVVSGDIAANTIAAVDMGTNSVTSSAVAADAVTEPKLDVLDTPADAEVLSWDNASSRFEWVAAGGTGTVTQVDTGTGLIGGPVNTTGTLSIDSTVATLTGTQTLTNKTIDADSNTLSNIDNNEIKAAAGIDYSKLNLSNSVVAGDLAANAAVLTFAKEADTRLTGNVDLKEGTNITLTQTGQTIEVASSAGGGTVTSVDSGTGLTGGPVTGAGTISATYGGSAGDWGTANTLSRSDHLHDSNYVELSGDTMTGVLRVPTLEVSASVYMWESGNNFFLYDPNAGPKTLSQLYLSIASQEATRLSGDVDIKAGTNVIITQTGQTIEVSSPAGGGTVTSVDSGAGLAGGPITTSGTLEVKYNNTTIGLNGSGSLEVKAASGIIALINTDETDSSGTTTSTAVKSYAVPANTYSRIMVEAEIGLDHLGNSDSEWNFILVYGGVNKETIPLRFEGSHAGDANKLSGVIKYSEAFAAGGTVQINVSAVTAAGTWYVRSFRVYGVI
jgi:hypothetical protein